MRRQDPLRARPRCSVHVRPRPGRADDLRRADGDRHPAGRAPCRASASAAGLRTARHLAATTLQRARPGRRLLDHGAAARHARRAPSLDSRVLAQSRRTRRATTESIGDAHQRRASRRRRPLRGERRAGTLRRPREQPGRRRLGGPGPRRVRLCRRVASTTSGSRPPTGDSTRRSARSVPGPAARRGLLPRRPARARRAARHLDERHRRSARARALLERRRSPADSASRTPAPLPGTAVTEQSGPAASPPRPAATPAAPLAGHTLVDQAVRRRRRHRDGRGGVDGCRGRRADAAPRHERQRPAELVAVLAAGHATSTSPPRSSARRARRSTPSPVSSATSDPITDTTNTVYLIDSQRFDDTHGAGRGRRGARAPGHARRHGPRRRRSRRRRGALGRRRPRPCAPRAASSMRTPAR